MHKDAQLANAFDVTTRTIYTWMDRWEDARFAGLYDQAGRGRKPKLNHEQSQQVKEWMKQFPKSPQTVLCLISEHYGIDMSKQTLHRVLDALGFSWRRVRRKPKGEPDPEEYAAKQEELEEYRQQASQGELA